MSTKLKSKAKQTRNQPKNWEKLWTGIEDMRKDASAPVDSMG